MLNLNTTLNILVNLLLLIIINQVVISYTQSDCETNRLNAVKSGQTKVRGVNLGSWFVLESWMSNKPWDDNNCNKNSAPGSYLLEKCLGSRAHDVMINHWSTWITEADFVDMSRRGINAVRLPVGWWQIYDPQGGASIAQLNYFINPKDYTTGGLAYIDKAFEWGKRHGIGIILVMHAAPGSQNGQPHSSPAVLNIVYWDKYEANVGQTVDSMELYAQRYANNQALLGFGLLNEPANVNITVLQDYYKRAFTAVRRHSANSYIVINPLIAPFEFGTETHWTGFMNPSEGFTKVVMDLHYYSCFGGPADQTDAAGLIAYIRYDSKTHIADYINNNPKPMLIGEWSACNHAPPSVVGEFTRAQVEVYSTANFGFTFWSWTDGSPGNVWSLKTAFNSGWTGNFNDTVC